jgi:hypothetical protein
MTAKEMRSASELARLVAQHIGAAGLTVTVLPDKVYGWSAWPTPVPEDVPDIHVKAQLAVDELRKLYELET